MKNWLKAIGLTVGVIVLFALFVITFVLLAKYTSFAFWYCLLVLWILYILTKGFKDYLDEKDS